MKSILFQKATLFANSNGVVHLSFSFIFSRTGPSSALDKMKLWFSQLQGKARLEGKLYSGLQYLVILSTHPFPKRAVLPSQDGHVSSYRRESCTAIIVALYPKSIENQPCNLSKPFALSLRHFTPYKIE